MYCSGCGVLLGDGQRVCDQCGRPVSGAVASPVAVSSGGAVRGGADVPGGGGWEPVAGGVSEAGPGPGLGALAQPSRVARNLQTVGTLWLVYAGWCLLQVLVAATILTGMSGMFGMHWRIDPEVLWSHFPFFNTPWVVTLITVTVVGRVILSAATGVGLLMRAPWGRTLGLVASFLTIFKPLFGMLLAIYTLWVLLPRASRQEYDEISLAAQ